MLKCIIKEKNFDKKLNKLYLSPIESQKTYIKNKNSEILKNYNLN